MAMDGEVMQKRRRRRQKQRWTTTTTTAIHHSRTLLVAIVLAFAIVHTTIRTNRRHRHRGCSNLGVLVAALTPAQRNTIVRSRIHRGMLLSQEAKHNVTAAEEACSVWESVLSRSSSSSSSSTTTTTTTTTTILTRDVLSLSKTLYASCLVRVGRDSEAVSVYDSCLTEFSSGNDGDEATTKWRFAKARCLQRLLKYSDAAEEYLRVLEDDAGIKNNSTDDDNDGKKQQAKLGAATCILRSEGDVVRAREILSGISEVSATHNDGEAALLLSCCLDYLETGNETQAANRLQEVLSRLKGSNSVNKQKQSSSFLLYRWILASLKRNHWQTNGINHPDTEDERKPTLDANDLFMELIRINTSPLDDPDLLRLDDKIELHNLLTATATTTTTAKDRPSTIGKVMPSSSSSYWPEGFILPAQSPKLPNKNRNNNNNNEDYLDLWISKSRAGYGSHGNQIVTLADVREQMINVISCDSADEDKPARNERTTTNTTTEPYLLQRMIDPLMLLGGYKFSLRIYVVYFSSDEAYISSKGLVKLASKPLLLSDSENHETIRDLSSNNNNNNSNRILDTKMHMTNSGRETVMQQEDLEYLWTKLYDDNSVAEKEELWKSICGVAADTLLVRYPARNESSSSSSLENEANTNDDFGCFDNDDTMALAVREQPQKHEWATRREHWGIPKILGLDFVVQDGGVGDADRNTNTNRTKIPWLVEVNRFPGLEPRDEDDRRIKYAIVRDAWQKASERLALQGGGNVTTATTTATNYSFGGFDGTIFESLRSFNGGYDDDDDDDGETQSSLERLQL